MWFWQSQLNISRLSSLICTQCIKHAGDVSVFFQENNNNNGKRKFEHIRYDIPCLLRPHHWKMVTFWIVFHSTTFICRILFGNKRKVCNIFWALLKMVCSNCYLDENFEQCCEEEVINSDNLLRYFHTRSFLQ